MPSDSQLPDAPPGSAPCSGSARYAKLIGRSPRVGRSSVTVLCACGWKSDHYTWSWAGHGKTQCPRCQHWIDYRTKQVFLDREDLEWVKRLRANSGEAPNC